MLGLLPDIMDEISRAGIATYWYVQGKRHLDDGDYESAKQAFEYAKHFMKKKEY